MNRHVSTVGLIVVLSALAMGRPLPQEHPAQSPASASTTGPIAPHDEKHLSKKEKKELKKAREQERKDEKHRLKKEAEQRKKEDKEREKELAKQRKHDRDHDRKKEDKEIAKEHHEDRKHRQEAEQRDAAREAGHEGPSMAGRVADAGVGLVTAPFKIARYATPRLLRAQRDVSHAIYSALPTSNVAVLLNDAGQIVLRGAAPNPSLRSRLLELAIGAAGGTPILDELAANFVGDVATAATSAAIGGVSDLIHGRSNDNGSDQPPSDPTQRAYAPPSEPAATNGGTPTATAVSALDPGSSACVNVTSNQVLLTGQATSQASAEFIRQFARQLGGRDAKLNDQLVTRSTGNSSAAPASRMIGDPDTNATAGGAATTALVAAGSNVCVNLDSGNQVLLTGTVSSPSDLTAVERAAQPLVASSRLVDQLTIGTVDAGSQVDADGGTSGSAAPTPSMQPPAGAAMASDTGIQATQSELEQVLHAIPRFSNLDVAMSADAVRLTGAVDTSQDEQMARDIARQHAPGRSIVDNITVTGRAPVQ